MCLLSLPSLLLLLLRAVRAGSVCVKHVNYHTGHGNKKAGQEAGEGEPGLEPGLEQAVSSSLHYTQAHCLARLPVLLPLPVVIVFFSLLLG